MNKFLIITVCVAITALAVSCSDRDPGRAYMPDMAYSRAYETYAPAQERLDASAAQGAHFQGRPVPGTIARGEMFAYTLKNDSTGEVLSAGVANPLAPGSIDMKEAERLYLVNCAICHGSKLDGQGPLWKDGNGPYPAAPKNLIADDYKNTPEGKMFHVATYGKGQMGSYASQLSTKQRWMVVAYVKSKQLPAGSSAAATDSTAAQAPQAAAADTSKAGAGK